MKNKKLGCAIFIIALFLLFFVIAWATCGSSINDMIDAIPEQNTTLEEAYQEHLDATK